MWNVSEKQSFNYIKQLNTMKKALLLMAVCCFVLQSQLSLAQNDSGLPKGINNSLSTEVENVSRKDAERIWKDLVKKFDGKTKKGKNNAWYTEKVDVPQLGSEGSVKMFMTINEKDKVAKTIFTVSKDGEFINYDNSPEEAQEVEKIYREYVYELKKKSYANESKNEEDELKDLNKDLEKLEKDNKKYHDEIEKCKKKIAEMESKITRNLDDQEMKKEEIVKQKSTVEAVHDKISSHKM